MVKKKWNESNSYTVNEGFVFAQNRVIQREISINRPLDPRTLEGSHGVDRKILLLGNISEDSDDINDTQASDYAKLFAPGIIKVESEKKFSPDFKANMKLLPVMLLEMSRYYMSMPEVFNTNSNSGGEYEPGAQEILDRFDHMKGMHTKVLTGLAGMIGIDAALDGEIDSVKNLVTAMGGSAIATKVAAIAGGVIGAGFLSISLTRQMNKAQLLRYSNAKSYISTIRDNYYQKYMQIFDEMMAYLHERVGNALEHRYGLPAEYSKQEYLKKCLSDLKAEMTDFKAATTSYDMSRAAKE